VGGKPSEVSLYVLSAEPLANKFILDRQLQKARRAKAELESSAPERLGSARTSMQNTRALMMAWQMYAIAPPPRAAGGKPARQDWSPADMQAMADEEQPLASLINSNYLDDYPPNFDGLAEIMEVPAETVTRCAKVLDRLAGKPWRVTKQVYTFSPQEMQDLEFEPAIPVLAELLSTPEGRLVWGTLHDCGPAALPAICAACRSTNATERINASCQLQSYRGASVGDLLLALLRDPISQVRYNAVLATAANWQPPYRDVLFGLLRDPDKRVGGQAAQWLTFHETADNTPRYLPLLNDPDPDVAGRALHVLITINPTAVPREQLLRLLGVPRMEVVSQSLRLLKGPQSLLSRDVTVSATEDASSPEKTLSSQEAAPLTTNRLSLAKLTGLKILSQNADADAVSLAIPMLRDTNSLVRTRAATVLHLITEQDFPEAQPATWEVWWQTNREVFKAR
jgi:HEAT repeat protein